MQACPHCGKENPDTDAYCYSCGHILLSELLTDGSTSKLEEIYENIEPQRRWGTAYFDRRALLRLTFRDTGEVLDVSVGDRLVLGRAHAADAGDETADIDLTPFGAVDKGVSRLHLMLEREHDTIFVTDLNSVNHTFLNGQRLMPHESRILRDNDELRLGHLVFRVTYV
jgi:hypothetical protein